MADRRTGVLLAVVVLAAALGVVLFGTGAYYRLTAPGPGDYERATVALVDENGTRLATVDVRIADSPKKRYVGLSNTESLAPGEGMLFVHGSEKRRTYVMRRMSFPLDIVFVGADGRVTRIHHAPVNGGDGDDSGYSGRGKWVLEVPRGFTNETGLDPGDRVAVPPNATGP